MRSLLNYVLSTMCQLCAKCFLAPCSPPADLCSHCVWGVQLKSCWHRQTTVSKMTSDQCWGVALVWWGGKNSANCNSSATPVSILHCLVGFLCHSLHWHGQGSKPNGHDTKLKMIVLSRRILCQHYSGKPDSSFLLQGTWPWLAGGSVRSHLGCSSPAVWSLWAQDCK